MVRANLGHVAGYGADQYSQYLERVLSKHFGPDIAAFPLFSGTGSNIVGPVGLCREMAVGDLRRVGSHHDR